MKILALDTSAEHCSCALSCGGEVRQRIERAGQRHSQLLIPMVQELLAEAELSLRALDGIAVCVGPGGFTGLRIGAAVGQGLAFGAGLPVAAVGSLEAVAWGTGRSKVLVCLDARMGEVYWAAYERAGSGLLIRAPSRVGPPGTVCAPDAAGWTGAGDGFARYADALATAAGAAVTHVLPDAHVEAGNVLTLAMARHPGGFSEPPDALVPVYVRDKVALTMAER